MSRACRCPGRVLYAANHVSWLDILALGGAVPLNFVARHDVGQWPAIGWAADLNDTIYIARDVRSSVKGQADTLRQALDSGRAVGLFPEGTTDGGRALLPFRASLFASLYPALPGVRVQPVAIDYGAVVRRCALDRRRALWRQCQAHPLAPRHAAGHLALPRSDRSARGRRPQGARRPVAACGRYGAWVLPNRGPIPYRPAQEMKTRNPKTFQVKSFGCQMNVYDGERMAELLEADGLTAAAEGEAADLVVLNTCHIREKAAEKVYSDIGRLMKRGAGEAAPMIAVAGCVAQAEGAEIPRRAPGVDIVVGPQAYHNLPELVRQAQAGERALDTGMPPLSKFGALPARRKQGPSAFLTVQEGCDKFCTYCVVPYTRGAEISRPFAAIVDEARALIDAGAKEITLLGQNVNAWREDDRGLDALIRALDALPGLARIRYTTSHPNDMTEGLIRAHAEVEKLMPFLHLPVQSGSDRVLKAMNRSHSTDSYLRILDRVRAARPDIAISGDFIVGFPGETEAEFEETLRIVGAVNYAQAFSFKYSPRPGTPAAAMEDQIAPEVMDERLQRLQALLNAQQLAFNRASVGRRTRSAARAARPEARPADRQDALAAIGPSRDRRRDRRPGRGRVALGRPEQPGGRGIGETRA